MICVRDASDQTHATLKARAKRQGISLSALLKLELLNMADRAAIAERPSMKEWLDAVRQDKPIRMKVSAAQIIRKMRGT
jgi:hypothetical protein